MTSPPPLQSRKSASRWLAIPLGLVGFLFVSFVLSDEIKAFRGSFDPYPSSESLPTDDSHRVTLAEYNVLGDGMSLADTERMIGFAGTEMSRIHLVGIETVMYSWRNPDGSNMNAMFQNGKLIQKAQFGLK